MSVDLLQPNPENAKIYGNEPVDEDLWTSVAQHGFHEPLIATKDNILIAGHRRLKAAKAAGIDRIPVIFRQYAGETEKLTALLESNRQRIKSNYVLGKEAILLKDIAAKQAKARQASGKKKSKAEKPAGGIEAGIDPASPTGVATGSARDDAGKKLGVSGVTLDKLVAVVKGIDRLEKAGKADEADALRDKLNKSADSGHKALKGKATPPAKTKPVAVEAKIQPQTERQHVAPVVGLKSYDAAITALNQLIQYFEDLDVEKIAGEEADHLLGKVNDLAATAKEALVIQ